MSVRLIVTKTLAALQTLLGSFAVGFAGSLVTTKAKFDTPTMVTPGYHLPGSANSELESVLLYLGLAIIICGFIQGLTGIKSGWWQAVCGLGVASVSAFLASKQGGVDYYLDSPIYFFAFLPMAFGIVVIVTGLLKLIPENLGSAS